VTVNHFRLRLADFRVTRLSGAPKNSVAKLLLHLSFVATSFFSLPDRQRRRQKGLAVETRVKKYNPPANLARM